MAVADVTAALKQGVEAAEVYLCRCTVQTRAGGTDEEAKHAQRDISRLGWRSYQQTADS